MPGLACINPHRAPFSAFMSTKCRRNKTFLYLYFIFCRFSNQGNERTFQKPAEVHKVTINVSLNPTQHEKKPASSVTSLAGRDTGADNPARTGGESEKYSSPFGGSWRWDFCWDYFCGQNTTHPNSVPPRTVLGF